MKPPHCAVCRADTHRLPADWDHEVDEFVLIRFGESQRMPSGWTGHPPGVDWFCTKHSPLDDPRRADDPEMTVIATVKANPSPSLPPFPPVPRPSPPAPPAPPAPGEPAAPSARRPWWKIFEFTGWRR